MNDEATNKEFEDVLNGTNCTAKMMKENEINGTERISLWKDFIKDKRRISNEVAKRMIGNVSNVEIKSALLDIDYFKATGQDGFTTAFFKKSWKVIGVDIFNVVGAFFISGTMLG
nr:RNA-directed DNA polymerase, eukaryota, reverse transcriptase zinc-binding domain protein [Tanacetum cinerariifolium]